MDRIKIVFLSLAVVALAGLAVLAAFSFTKRTNTTIASLPAPQQTVQALRALPAAATADIRPALSAADQEKLASLEYELNELPREEELSGDLANQVQRIRQLRARVAGLQTALSRNYARLMAETTAAAFGSEDHFEEDLELSELQQKLTAAKADVAFQREALLKFEGSDSTDITRGYQAELTRRQGVVTGLEEDIADLVFERRSRASLKNARLASRLRAWRAERTQLENDHSGAIEALEHELRNYELMIKNAGDSRQRLKQLEGERNRLQVH